MNKSLAVMAAVLACAFISCCPENRVFDQNKAAFAVISDKSENIGYAVVYQEHASDLVFLSSAHFFDKAPSTYRVSLGYRAVKKVWKPDPRRDVIFFTISKQGLTRGKDFDLPSFAVDVGALRNAYLQIFNDGLYGVESRRIEDESGDGYLLSGEVEKGRSGSPVFIKGTDRCLGVVSGYYPETRQTLVLAP